MPASLAPLGTSRTPRKVLVLSSQVVSDAVGLHISGPVLHAHHLDVLALPTTLLSSHAGRPSVAGAPTDPALLQKLIHALDETGTLDGVDAVLTGYMPSAAHVSVAVEAIGRVRSATARPCIIVDPIIGDWPKGLYVNADAAAAIRDQLVPLADVIKPNAFELGWLTGRSVHTVADAQQAVSAMPMSTIVSSLAAGDGQLATMLHHTQRQWVSTVNRRSAVPKGTGDLLVAVTVAGLMGDRPLVDAVARAVAIVDACLAEAAIQAHSMRDQDPRFFMPSVVERIRDAPAYDPMRPLPSHA